MIRVAILFLKDALRDRVSLFWGVAFPVFLMVVFGLIWGGGGGEVKIPVYIYDVGGQMGRSLAEALNSAFDVKLVESISDPETFVVKKTAEERRPVTLVVVNRSVTVYSTSTIWGNIVHGYLRGVAYDRYLRGGFSAPYAEVPNATRPESVQITGIAMVNFTNSTSLELPLSVAVRFNNKTGIEVVLQNLNITMHVNESGAVWGGGAWPSQAVDLKIVGSDGGSLSLGALRVATALVLVVAMQAGVVGTAATLTSLITLGLNKRAALSRIRKYKVAAAATVSNFLFSLIGATAVIVVATFFRVDGLRLAATWQLWASYLLNFLFFAGIGLLMTNAVVFRKVRPASVVNAATALFLLFAFTTGYFMPLEILPRDLLNFALAMPTSYTMSFALAALQGGSPPLAMLAYPAAATAVAYAVGLAWAKLYAKP
ncbi:ABC-2 type transporter [Pyrobaculum oguniense TE7]|uniref:ABC-2 type transporter n=1 Tax=Pyrobaculum oguniense (strain DSM 13380 / JCM 10595 / TE7) TaxID=698757 RepID=H6QDU1_PYROT|nr:ABC-2 type transporter [Pyrobaculum oguniense TE7]